MARLFRDLADDIEGGKVVSCIAAFVTAEDRSNSLMAAGDLDTTWGGHCVRLAGELFGYVITSTAIADVRLNKAAAARGEGVDGKQ
jgi:hypothetical protein